MVGILGLIYISISQKVIQAVSFNFDVLARRPHDADVGSHLKANGRQGFANTHINPLSTKLPILALFTMF